MSLKRCVVCIVGNIQRDMFSSASWTENGGGALDRKKIEGWFEGKLEKLIWDTMDKSVTHLVISRSAFKARHDAVKFVEKDRREKKKAKIVTYDWLEDSLANNKAIQDVSAYDPSKPRDIPAILAARRKDPKSERSDKTKENKTEKGMCAPKGLDENEQEDTNREDTRQTTEAEKSIRPEHGSASKGEIRPAISTLRQKPATKMQSKPVTGTHKISTQATTKANPTKSDLAKSLPPVRSRLPPLTPRTQVAPQQKPVAREKPNADPVASFIKKDHTVYLDKLDKFKYQITLKHKDANGESWHLSIWESTSDPANKKFLFRELYCKDNRGSLVFPPNCKVVPSSREAIKHFATSFRARMSYDWDERLIRAAGPQPSNWRYRLPLNKTTGATPPEYTPGHPRCKKLEDLPPILQKIDARHAAASSPRKPVNASSKAVYRREIKKAPSARAEPKSLKRKAGEAPAGPSRYSKFAKVTKPSSSKVKSAEFIIDSDDDSGDDSRTLPQQKSRRP